MLGEIGEEMIIFDIVGVHKQIPWNTGRVEGGVMSWK